MVTPDWEIVARAVCNMEALGMGLTKKSAEKYVESNWQNRVPEIQEAYSEQMNRWDRN